MNKISVVAFIAALGFAVPAALAQTPSDIRNGRTPFAENPAAATPGAGEVRVDRHEHMPSSSEESPMEKGGKHHHHHHHHAKKHEGKHHHHHAKKHKEEKKMEEKKDDKSGK